MAESIQASWETVIQRLLPSPAQLWALKNEGSYSADPHGILGLRFYHDPASGVAGETGNCPLGSLGWSSLGIYLSSDNIGEGGSVTLNDIAGDLYYEILLGKVLF